MIARMGDAGGMRAARVVFLVLASSCATVPAPQPEHGSKPVTPDVVARAKLEAVLARLPACGAGIETAVLVLSPTVCTERACASACCNACGWSASAGGARVDERQVRALLELAEGGMDCEIAMWSEVLSKRPLSVGGGCVAR